MDYLLVAARLICLGTLAFVLASPTSADIKLDSSSVVPDAFKGQVIIGPSTGKDAIITENMGTRSGNNLFHSFDTFNINTGETASFTSVQPTSNIIARVTGGTLTTIDGRLTAGANFWLLNPAGISLKSGRVHQNSRSGWSEFRRVQLPDAVELVDL